MFTLLERAVAESHGEDAWDDMLEGAGLAGAYPSLGDYADADRQPTCMLRGDRSCELVIHLG